MCTSSSSYRALSANGGLHQGLSDTFSSAPALTTEERSSEKLLPYLDLSKTSEKQQKMFSRVKKDLKLNHLKMSFLFGISLAPNGLQFIPPATHA